MREEYWTCCPAQMYGEGRTFREALGTNVRCNPLPQSLKECSREWDSEGEAMLKASEYDSRVQVPSHVDQVVAPQWYAISTRSRHEKLVRDRFAGMGVESFLPLTKKLKQWSDRRVWTESPLFAGYCFARFSLMNGLAILQTPGVVRIVGITVPEAIPDEEMASLKQLAESERQFEPHDYFVDGAWVQVVRGPLTGLRGQLLRKSGHHSLVVRVHLIRQAATVHIDMNEVVALQ